MVWLSYMLSNIVLASLLALIAFLAQRVWRRYSLARVLWILALFKLATPPLASVQVGVLPAAMACTLGVCSCGPHSPIQSMGGIALPWALLAAWSIGAGIAGWTAWRRWTSFRRLIARAEVAPADWQLLAANVAEELRFRRPPVILAAPGRFPPLVVVGWPRPRLILPRELLKRLSSSQREALLLHELVHLHRGDHLVRLLELALSVIFWWLPLVAWIGRQLRTCEEACCDAAVLAHRPRAQRDYALLLLEVLDFVANAREQPSGPATAMSAALDLERRLRAILSPSPKCAPRRWSPAVFALVLACAVLPLGLQYEWTPRSPREEIDSAAAGASSLSSNEDLNDVSLATMCCPN